MDAHHSTAHLPALTFAAVDTAALAATFLATGYVELTAAFAPEWRHAVAAHTQAALDHHGRRVDVQIKATDDSPRRYRLAGRAAIEATGNTIPALYRNPTLLALLSSVTTQSIHPVPYLPEEYIATRFEEPGDTHGWHWDDYAFALIWVNSAPPPEHGGSLECIPNIPWNKAQPQIHQHLTEHAAQKRHPASDTVYLLRADTTLHRVSPLTQASTREILCLSYTTTPDLERPITHETLEQLYEAATA